MVAPLPVRANCGSESGSPPLSGDGMPEQARPLWRELWLTGAWRLFPLLAIYMSGEPRGGWWLTAVAVGAPPCQPHTLLTQCIASLS